MSAVVGSDYLLFVGLSRYCWWELLGVVVVNGLVLSFGVRAFLVGMAWYCWLVWHGIIGGCG